MLLGLLFRNPNVLLYFDKEHRQNDRSFEYQQHTGLCVRRYLQIGIDCQKRNGNAIRNFCFRKTNLHPSRISKILVYMLTIHYVQSEQQTKQHNVGKRKIISEENEKYFSLAFGGIPVKHYVCSDNINNLFYYMTIKINKLSLSVM